MSKVKVVVSNPRLHVHTELYSYTKHSSLYSLTPRKHILFTLSKLIIVYLIHNSPQNIGAVNPSTISYG